jgi:hypothetical protein
MKKKQGKIQIKHVQRTLLQGTARTMLPLYRRVANDGAYALRFARAIREQGNTRIDRIIKETVPSVSSESIEVEQDGFFICFGVVGSQLCNLTAVRTNNKIFRANEFRLLSKLVVPVYLRLATDRQYLCRIVNAINTHNDTRLSRVVREQVKSPYLQTVTGASGSALQLKFRFSNGATYENSFFLGQ